MYVVRNCREIRKYVQKMKGITFQSLFPGFFLAGSYTKWYGYPLTHNLGKSAYNELTFVCLLIDM